MLNEIIKFLLQYIKLPNGTHELLTEDNAHKFLNKKIKMRSPMFCASDSICRHCIGELPSLLKLRNIGLTTGRISNTM